MPRVWFLFPRGGVCGRLRRLRGAPRQDWAHELGGFAVHCGAHQLPDMPPGAGELEGAPVAMLRILAMAALLTGLVSAQTSADLSSADKVPSRRGFSDIRKEEEILRGKKFRHAVPVYEISEKELRAISDRELQNDFPGPKLRCYSELLAWLDMVPSETDLKAVCADFLVDQLVGLYDADTKELCIPAFPTAATNPHLKAAEEKLEAFSAQVEDLVSAHEFTHALEDQYWPPDDPRDDDFEVSTDRGTAHDFLTEGSAPREMVEVIS